MWQFFVPWCRPRTCLGRHGEEQNSFILVSSLAGWLIFLPLSPIPAVVRERE